ncbi:hypothetical protein [Streptomyces sp. NPDC001828]|uniref:hypothetical protein n=1 Tax=Streptomyces sp. NPDC001828 TaxID=3364615 RepID=UPI0036B55653
MDSVYVSLDHRPGAIPDSPTEAAEALDTLWAHTTPEDDLEHVSARTYQAMATAAVAVRRDRAGPAGSGAPGICPAAGLEQSA